MFFEDGKGNVRGSRSLRAFVSYSCNALIFKLREHRINTNCFNIAELASSLDVGRVECLLYKGLADCLYKVRGDTTIIAPSVAALLKELIVRHFFHDPLYTTVVTKWQGVSG